MSGYQIVHLPDTVTVARSIVRDRRVSASDLGVYVRFVDAAEMFHTPDIDLLAGEMRMPREETEAAIARLVALEYLDDLSDRPVLVQPEA
ncbi:hypothetical protein [Streptomyces sp. CBMA156]|uniref:hypothetical protein n=1 Tax=Streptomyces sp. CBMA156 TaxID=1930280 RepID=UPI001661FD48|nr:hypothetical protein [Streptomyces sp. CBMA156]MBD0671639.1 hypothetical protein [Streptomyces sp. CBMA156]